MKWLQELPSTNAKIAAGIGLSFMVVGTACALELRGRSFNEVILLELITFCLGWAGISYVQFAKKRDTYRASPPAAPDIEDAPGAVLTREGAELAARHYAGEVG